MRGGQRERYQENPARLAMDHSDPSTRTRWVGGVAWIVGPLAFGVATTVEALLLRAHGYPYSFLTNTISNLGDPSLYPYPYYWMLNLSAIALGLLVFLGVPAFSARRPHGPLGMGAVVLLVLTGVGAIGVGIFNEHLNYPVHITVAALAFISGGLTLLAVGIAGLVDVRWRPWAVPSLIGAAVTTVALVAFGINTTWLLGHGGWERLIVAAPILWVIAQGISFLYRPSGSSRGTPSRSG